MQSASPLPAGPAQSGILVDREVVSLFLHFTVNPKPRVEFIDRPRCCLRGKECSINRFQQVESRWGYSGTSDRIRWGLRTPDGEVTGRKGQQELGVVLNGPCALPTAPAAQLSHGCSSCSPHGPRALSHVPPTSFYRFSVNKRIFVVGFGLYGSIHGPTDYQVNIQVSCQPHPFCTVYPASLPAMPTVGPVPPPIATSLLSL